MDTQDVSIQCLLIVREVLRLGSEAAYDRNERELAEVSATLNCPHPYLALASLTSPGEIWWFNTFESEQERDGLEATYAQNEPLMTAMVPLGKRKEGFRHSVTSTMTRLRPDLSDGTVLEIIGARFFIVNRSPADDRCVGMVFESPDGERFAIASAHDRPAADKIADLSGPGAVILAVQPQWSFPARAWIDADREFWKDSPAARNCSGGSY